jgi:hypothetical protein
MKRKEIGKYYFGIGIRDDYQRLIGSEIFFYFFKLKKRPPSGEMLLRGRDYSGFILSRHVKLPNWYIEL